MVKDTYTQERELAHERIRELDEKVSLCDMLAKPQEIIEAVNEEPWLVEAYLESQSRIARLIRLSECTVNNVKIMRAIEVRREFEKEFLTIMITDPMRPNLQAEKGKLNK